VLREVDVMHVRVVVLGLALLASGAGAANALPEASPDTTDSGALFSRAIEQAAHRSVRPEEDDGAALLSSGVRQGKASPSFPKCHSKKKGALIGGAIGAAAGAVFGIYVAKGVGGVLGTANGAPRFISYVTLAGAGAGALGGVLYCRT
jgi:hypothetical protein